MPFIRWTDIAITQPPDGDTVWIHRFSSPNPYQAIWHAGTATFTLASGLVLPWYLVINWRAL